MKITRKSSDLLLIVLSVFLVSCGSKESSREVKNQLGKMEIVIPEELKDNPEIVTYIEGMCEVVDEYALLLDNMIGELGGIEGREWEELKVGEQLKYTKTAAKFAIKAAPITAKWGELETKRVFNEDELTEEEMKALETILERIEARMEQIEDKNREFFSEAGS